MEETVLDVEGEALSCADRKIDVVTHVLYSPGG